MQKNIALLVFLVVCGLAVWHALHFHEALPEMIRADTYEAGSSNDLKPKSDLLFIYLAAIVGTVFCFPVLGLLMSKMPDKWINLPRKDYWLAPQRRKATMDFMAVYMAWFGTATVIFIMFIFHACFEATLGDDMRPYLPIPGALVTGCLYGGFILAWCIWPMVRFYSAPKAASA